MSKREVSVNLGYTTIQHDPRLKFTLSTDTYCVADAIYNLANNPSSIVLGWCFASRQKIADFFGISKRSVQRSIQELVDKQLVEIHKETKYLRTTQIWYDEFVVYSMMKVKERSTF